MRPEEHARLGEITVEAYVTLDGHVAETDYEVELRNIAARAEAPATVVLVAAEDDGRALLMVRSPVGLTHSLTSTIRPSLPPASNRS